MDHEKPPEQASHEIRRGLLDLPIVTELQGYHVTDDPQVVLNVLRAGIPLDREHDVSLTDDLQASGLYFSEAPQLWTGRAINHWRFVERLTEEQRSNIAQAILQDSRFTGEWYLTASEKECAARWLERFLESGKAVYLCFLAEQPYNVQAWKPNFLAQFGITNSATPHEVPVKVNGIFADVSSARISSELIVTLKQGGYDGVFVRGSIAFLPQAVVWNSRAIVQFGDYILSKEALADQILQTGRLVVSEVVEGEGVE